MRLTWLPETKDWAVRLRAIASCSTPWDDAVALSRHQLDGTKTNSLDRAVQEVVAEPPGGLSAPPIRLALLSSSTTGHLHSAIRVAGLRRNLWIDICEPAYGQYMQALSDPDHALHRFQPNAVLLSLDAHHLAAGVNASMRGDDFEDALSQTAQRIGACWRAATIFGCPIIQEIPLPLHPSVIGNNDHRLPGSKAAFLRRLSDRLRSMADQERVDLLSLDLRTSLDGLGSWYDPEAWYRAKQAITPHAAPFYGDLVVRLLAAQRGLSAKCLVLDLDNTLWGGVIGDAGNDGIELGQGSPLGEAFVALQDYARELSRRGVILAVCSKNDEVNAIEPFVRHPEMLLRRPDIACFMANWDDKATNLRRIADELRIGLDSMVFLDDNPFERELVRRELPMVLVPEISDEPATYPRVLEDAGYFEATQITVEDTQRTAQYTGNAERSRLQAASSDLAGYLRSLDMRLLWRRFDRVGLPRIVQLINKTNQFNLTTRRRSEADILAIIDDPRYFGLQLRLIDRLGDNGMISVVIGHLHASGAFAIDTWLMSCRVLGRGVEAATLDLIAQHAKEVGAVQLLGEYRRTAKNGMVQDHYDRLGFAMHQEDGDSRLYHLDLSVFEQRELPLSIEREMIG